MCHVKGCLPSCVRTRRRGPIRNENKLHCFLAWKLEGSGRGDLLSCNLNLNLPRVMGVAQRNLGTFRTKPSTINPSSICAETRSPSHHIPYVPFSESGLMPPSNPFRAERRNVKKCQPFIPLTGFDLEIWITFSRERY